MAALSIENVLKQAARLTPSERLILASRLIEGVRQEIPAKNGKPLKWRHLRGSYPILLTVKMRKPISHARDAKTLLNVIVS